MLDKKISQLMPVLLLFYFAMTASVATGNSLVGIESGGWVKYSVTVSNLSAGSVVPSWVKIDFLNVQGTNITEVFTLHYTNGTEFNETETSDLTVGGAVLPGFLIPANSNVGDLVNLAPTVNTTITNESTKTYLGASRTVISANLTQYGNAMTFYWDKPTGVMMELSMISGTQNALFIASETNIWAAGPLTTNWLFWTIIIIAFLATIVATAFIMRERRPKTTTPPQKTQPSASSPNGTPQGKIGCKA